MWIKLKNGEIFNLNYAEKIYSYMCKSKLYGVAINKKMLSKEESKEIIIIKDGLTIDEAKKVIENILFLTNFDLLSKVGKNFNVDVEILNIESNKPEIHTVSHYG